MIGEQKICMSKELTEKKKVWFNKKTSGGDYQVIRWQV